MLNWVPCSKGFSCRSKHEERSLASFAWAVVRALILLRNLGLASNLHMMSSFPDLWKGCKNVLQSYQKVLVLLLLSLENMAAQAQSAIGRYVQGKQTLLQEHVYLSAQSAACLQIKAGGNRCCEQSSSCTRILSVPFLFAAAYRGAIMFPTEQWLSLVPLPPHPGSHSPGRVYPCYLPLVLIVPFRRCR